MTRISTESPFSVDSLIFQNSPIVEFAGNFFRHVPVILQYDQTPLVQVGRFVEAGYTTKLHIFDKNDNDLAVVNGAQIYKTPAGEKAGIRLRHFPGITACELAGKTLFEVRRKDAAALKTQAELYTPDGSFIKCDSAITGVAGGQALLVPRCFLAENYFEGLAIAVLITSDGKTRIGVSRPPQET